MNETAYPCDEPSCEQPAVTERKWGIAYAEYCSEHASAFDQKLNAHRRQQIKVAAR